MSTYQNLDTMLRSNVQARAYFQALPHHVREHIASQPMGVNSPESLMNYAQSLHLAP